MRINEQGRSMIEMLGVLAIVGVLSVGGIAGYSKAMNKFKTNKVIDQINMISTNIRTLYSSQRNYSGLNNEVSIKVGLIPAEMYDASKNSGDSYDGKLTHALGGTVEISSAPTAGDSEGAYIIAIDGVPASACISIATTDWGGDSGSGLVGMYVETAKDASAAKTELNVSAVSADANTAVPGDTTNGLPFTLLRANVACSTSGNAAIGWKFM